jgi:hypothetical protein
METAVAPLSEPFSDDGERCDKAGDCGNATRNTSNDRPEADYLEPPKLDRGFLGIFFQQPNFSFSGVLI